MMQGSPEEWGPKPYDQHLVDELVQVNHWDVEARDIRPEDADAIFGAINPNNQVEVFQKEDGTLTILTKRAEEEMSLEEPTAIEEQQDDTHDRFEDLFSDIPPPPTRSK